MLFNQVLELRERDGSWADVLPGDVAKKHDTGGLFDVPLEGADLDDARSRAAAGLVSATGPMFGAKMRWPQGAPLALERQILEATIGPPERLEAVRSAGEGTRRTLRMMVGDVTTEAVEGGAGLVVSFVLPKGGYATTVLARACRLLDASRLGYPGFGGGTPHPGSEGGPGRPDEPEPPHPETE
jgi:tRNA pseudouridine13 synthase